MLDSPDTHPTFFSSRRRAESKSLTKNDLFTTRTISPFGLLRVGFGKVHAPALSSRTAEVGMNSKYNELSTVASYSTGFSSVRPTHSLGYGSSSEGGSSLNAFPA